MLLHYGNINEEPDRVSLPSFFFDTELVKQGFLVEVVPEKIKCRKSCPKRREENPGERDNTCKDTEEGASIFEVTQHLVQKG